MKTFKFYLLLQIIFFFQFSEAQLNIDGTPFSFKESFSYLSERNIPKITLEKQYNEYLKTEAEGNDTKSQPWEFGVNINKIIDVIKESDIIQIPDGSIRRLSIFSEDALSINLRFSRYKLPENATLYIYNEEKSEMIGGFTSMNNRENGIFATGLLKGEKIILEYFEPKNAEFHGELTIDRVTHGFRSVNEYNKSFGGSGDCNMNVACDDGTMSDEIRAVCLLVAGGNAFCTGSLINNTANDGRPFILSANHCYRDPDDMVFMFNWESETCDNPLESPSHDDLSGAQLIARHDVSDFMLLEMYDEPPYNYEIYYAGWNSENVSSTSSIGIHHPSGDIKKISYDDDPSSSDSYLGEYPTPDTHWKVTWNRETTTEPGSSGSPLFNQNRQIIGQLHGGDASCDNLNESDWYGKFSYSWNTGQTAETRLKDWLDPQNTGLTELGGYDPNVPVTDIDAQLLGILYPETYYFGENTIKPTLKLRNRGNSILNSLRVNYQINDNELQTINWNGNIATSEIIEIQFPELTLNSGIYNFLAYIDLPNGTVDEYQKNDTLSKVFYIYENIFEDDFENANTWYLTGEFEVAKPLGLGGESGYPDPEEAFSGNKILGTDLNGLGAHPGDYEDDIEYDTEYAQSPVINCSKFENTTLTFMRYLGVEKKRYDQVSVEIEAEDSLFVLWENPQYNLKDTVWNKQTFDISKYADGKKIIIRFKTDYTDDADQFCGWNIDDFIVSGIRKKPDDPTTEQQIKIYPNPADNFLYAEFDESTDEPVLVTISDITGKIVYEKNFEGNEIKNASHNNTLKLIYIKNNFLDSGLFIINIKTSTSSFSEKIIIP